MSWFYVCVCVCACVCVRVVVVWWCVALVALVALEDQGQEPEQFLVWV